MSTASSPFLGSHMSTAGGVDKAPARGASVGCTAMQIFVKNNNRWEGPPITDTQATAFRAELKKAGIAVANVFAHACYLINLAAIDPAIAAKSVSALADELRRCGQLGLPGLVIHPGSHMGAGVEAGLEQAARLAREAIDATPESKTRVLFETTVGAGRTLGGNFGELASLLKLVKRPSRTGVCLDTCHVFCAGYDLRTPGTYNATVEEFDRIVGLKHLRAIHLNDSKHPLGSRKDRHEHIGKGHLGLEPFRLLLNDPRMAGIPMSLETDKEADLEDDRINLGVLRGLIAQ